MYDSVIPSANRTLLLQMVAGLAVGSLVGGMFQLVQGLTQLRFLGRMEANLEAAVWDRLLNLPAVFFRRFSSGDLANRGHLFIKFNKRFRAQFCRHFSPEYSAHSICHCCSITVRYLGLWRW